VQSQLRYTKKGMFVVVRCGDAPARAVRVVYTGVTVPNLVGADDHSLSTLTAMLGLNINELSRRAQADEEPNTIVEQHPAAGTVVPFGTTMTVVIASQPLTELRVKGAFTTSTAASVPGSGLECGMHQSRFIFETNAMRLEGGTEVARVEITLPGFTGPGTYPAKEPLLQYRRTPVQVVTASNAATGSGDAFFIATRGRVRVRTGGPTSPRATSGAVQAHLVQQGGSVALTLTGSWSCA
jgi:hypothetical protein